jgi:hypothetical protein
VNLCFSAACVAKAAACSSFCRLSRGSDIHSRITVRRASCSGLIFKTFQTLDNDYRQHNAYLRRSSTAWRWRARLPFRRSADCWSVRVVNGSCVFMECGDFLPTSMSAESGPPVDNCAYSSSSAGMRPARKKTTGSSSKSPSSASPVRDHAITPTLLCARRSAVRRAAGSDLHATGGSARRRVPRPARNDCTM